MADTSASFGGGGARGGTTTTLANALLEDLNDLSDLGGSDHEEGNEEEDEKSSSNNQQDLQFSAADETPVSAATVKVSPVSALLKNTDFQAHIHLIQRVLDGAKSGPAAAGTSTGTHSNTKNGSKDNDDDVSLLWKTMHVWLARVETAIHEGHLECRALYKPRFADLADLIPNVWQYVNTILTFGSTRDFASCLPDLQIKGILTPNQVLTLSVAAAAATSTATTRTPDAKDEENDTVLELCRDMMKLKTIQEQLHAFVESQMMYWAPNMTTLVGSTCAAQCFVLSAEAAFANYSSATSSSVSSTSSPARIALAQLVKIPACNLQVLGKHENSNNNNNPSMGGGRHRHAGILMSCPLVQQCPPAAVGGRQSMQHRALKLVASKLALCIRADYVSSTTTTTTAARKEKKQTQEPTLGKRLRGEILQKYQQWATPAKAPVLKSLPKPDLSTKKHRGGKRMRRWKEQFQETDMMKQANKRAFSVASGTEYGDDAMGLSLGMLESSNSKGLNAATARPFRQANTKKSRKRKAAMLKQSGGGSISTLYQQHNITANPSSTSSSATSGLASSVVFTPVQGMELVDPTAAQQKRRVQEANEKWFHANAGFASAKPKSTSDQK